MTIQHHFAAAALAVLALTTTGAANAISQGDNVVVGIGMFDDSCDKWVAARAAGRDSGIKADEYLTVTWMQGYLSGANLTRMYADPKLTIALPSSSEISSWLDKACKAEPQTPVFFLANNLVKELQKRAGK